MSEMSTPSMQLHPISPSSSLSSADSAPHSEPTSDEQPDLGAFTTVLREWNHLQPGPRIPIQRRSATSSTTPTFQPSEPSVAGSIHTSSYRPTSSYRRRVPSTQSTFTRPPSSSAFPEEGSTVWAHGLIADYLLSATPSNDYDLDDYYELDDVEEERESQYDPSPPNSLASASQTVEINSESDADSVRISPYPYSETVLVVPVHGASQRLNSRESHYHVPTDDASTYRIQQSSSQDSRSSIGSYGTSLQIQSQAPLSSSSSSGTDVLLSVVSTTSSVHDHESNAANSQSTTMSNFHNNILNRSQNPIPPQTAYPSPNVEAYRYAATSTTGSLSRASVSTQRPSQQVPQRLHDGAASPPLLNPHSPQPSNRQAYEIRNHRLTEVVNDWGTPDQAPSETLLFEPSTVPRSRPIVNDDDDDEEIIAVRQTAPVHRMMPHTTGHSDANNPNTYTAHPTTNPVASGSTSTQTQMRSDNHSYTGSNVTIAPHNEDAEEDEDMYNYRFPYSHGVTPRYYGSALTPRGLPHQSDNPQSSSQGWTATQAQASSSSHPSQPQATNTHTSTRLNDSTHGTATYSYNVPGPSQAQPSQPQSHPYLHKHVLKFQPQELHNNKSHNVHSQYIDTQDTQSTAQQQGASQQNQNQTSRSIHHSTTQPQSQSQSQTQAHRAHPDLSSSGKHGYPHSLLGLHALPASLVSPGSEDLPTDFMAERKPGPSNSHALVKPRANEPRLQQTNHDDAHEHDHAHKNDYLEDEALPSLGALDEVLEFIAVERERARTNAAREAASFREANSNTADESDTADDRDHEEAGPGEADSEWTHIVDTVQQGQRRGQEQGQEVEPEREAEPEPETEPPKRRRRRKRPNKANAAAAIAAGVGADAPETTSISATTESRTRRKRVRSSSRSAASSLQTQNKIEKEFLVDPHAVHISNAGEKGKTQITILKRPSGLSDDDYDDDEYQDMGAKTPTNNPAPGASRDMDMRYRDAFQDRAMHADDFQFDFEDDNAGGRSRDYAPAAGGSGGNEVEGEGGGGGNETSFSTMPLLQPPRRKRDKMGHDNGKTRDATYIHDVLGGSYRSTPGTPGRSQAPLEGNENQYSPEDNGTLGLPDSSSAPQDNIEESGVGGSSGPTTDKKKRVRKHKKAIQHAKSVPDLKNEPEQKVSPPAEPVAETVLPGLSRAKSLGKQNHVTLRGRDPADTQRDELERFLAASYNAMPGLFMMERPGREAQMPDPPDPSSKRGRLITLASQLRHSFPEQSEELDKLITRFSRPQSQKMKAKRRKAAGDNVDGAEATNNFLRDDEEVEIDTRGRSMKRSAILTHVFIDHSNILIGLLTHIRRLRQKRRQKAMRNTSSSANPNRPLPFPIYGDGHGMTVQNSHSYPIPLPSFATSRSLPTKSIFSGYADGRLSDDATNDPDRDSTSDDFEEIFNGSSKSEAKNQLTHLWHAALVLILERGRDINRRVVVTSSPLYQPMDTIERLGYDLRVYLRVPDLGAGLDRERQKEKYGAKPSNNGKGASNPGTTKDDGLGHMRQGSGNASTDSGDAAYSTPSRVRYREQGVDELLQLKLHQALIATDIPPDGSTIVLATGDGNTGQFNEDGFLGAVRAALRKGWRVELYSWEYGLSSSWRREFGDFSRRGMFRIIYMEQFASSLLESDNII